jgi:hypothetical protein
LQVAASHPDTRRASRCEGRFRLFAARALECAEQLSGNKGAGGFTGSASDSSEFQWTKNQSTVLFRTMSTDWSICPRLFVGDSGDRVEPNLVRRVCSKNQPCNGEIAAKSARFTHALSTIFPTRAWMLH